MSVCFLDNSIFSGQTRAHLSPESLPAQNFWRRAGGTGRGEDRTRFRPSGSGFTPAHPTHSWACLSHLHLPDSCLATAPSLGSSLGLHTVTRRLSAQCCLLWTRERWQEEDPGAGQRWETGTEVSEGNRNKGRPLPRADSIPFPATFSLT